MSKLWTAVSIHAHHYWRAIQNLRAFGAESDVVSIHAHHYWRAIRLPGGPLRCNRLFQSTPTITGGRFNDGATLTRCQF